MRIHFKGTTNKNYVMINTLIMTDPSGDEVVIDRDCTEYSIHDGILEMTWSDCYVWDGETQRYLTDEDENFLTSLRFQELELEDDADEDYDVQITSYGCEFSTHQAPAFNN